MFQVSGHSVMQGQAVYFSFFSAERSPGAISRYINETRRVYGVLEIRLAEQREALSRAASRPSSQAEDTEPQFLTDEEASSRDDNSREDELDSESPVWLVGDQCSIADLSFLTWANVVDRIGIDLETEYPVDHPVT
jgi:glutathione S-transferase